MKQSSKMRKLLEKLNMVAPKIEIQKEKKEIVVKSELPKIRKRIRFKRSK